MKSRLSVELVPKGNAGEPLLDSHTEVEMKPKGGVLGSDEGFFITVRAVLALRSRMKRMIVLGIAGPSGAGKTTLAQRIVSVLPQTCVISMDNYLDATRKVIDQNFDDHRLIDFALLRKNIEELKAKKPTAAPLYDFRKSGRYAYKLLNPPASDVLIVEGTYALHSEIRDILDLKVSVSGGVHNDLIKRILRDIHRTGQQPQEALNQITQTVYPMYKAYIEPDLRQAHIRIGNKFNPFTALVNPTYLIRFDPIDKQVIEEYVRSEGGRSKTADETSYDIYLHQADSPPTTCKEWIRVRNSEGRYQVQFSDNIVDDGFIISPQINFVVQATILGGLMALGYKIGAIINRSSHRYKTDELYISFEYLTELKKEYVTIKGNNRQKINEAAEKLGIKRESLITKTYIEMYQEVFLNTPAATTSTESSSTTANITPSKL